MFTWNTQIFALAFLVTSSNFLIRTFYQNILRESNVFGNLFGLSLATIIKLFLAVLYGSHLGKVFLHQISKAYIKYEPSMHNDLIF